MAEKIGLYAPWWGNKPRKHTTPPGKAVNLPGGTGETVKVYPDSHGDTMKLCVHTPIVSSLLVSRDENEEQRLQKPWAIGETALGIGCLSVDKKVL